MRPKGKDGWDARGREGKRKEEKGGSAGKLNDS